MFRVSVRRPYLVQTHCVSCEFDSHAHRGSLLCHTFCGTLEAIVPDLPVWQLLSFLQELTLSHQFLQCCCSYLIYCITDQMVCLSQFCTILQCRFRAAGHCTIHKKKECEWLSCHCQFFQFPSTHQCTQPTRYFSHVNNRNSVFRYISDIR